MKICSKIQLLILTGMMLFILTSCQNLEAKEEIIYEDSRFILGTIVSVKIFDHGSEELLDMVFTRLSDIESKMSMNIEESEVNAINKMAGIEPVRVSEDTYNVIKESIEFSKLSEGRFDITMGPVVKLWGIGTENAKVPGEDDLKMALSLVDYKTIHLNDEDQSVYLEYPQMEIDLGGIAKGFAADEIAELLEEHNVEKAMINLGGNVYGYGEKSDGSPWKIGIQNPFEERNNYFSIISVRDKTIVTSGTYERYFIQDGKTYHHIFDNKTGFPVENEVASITIVTEQSIDADALSTILFSLGVENGLELVNSMENTECIFVTKDKDIYLSQKMENYFELIDKSFDIKN